MSTDMEPWVYAFNVAGVIVGFASIVWGLIKRRRETLLFAGITFGIVSRMFDQPSNVSVGSLVLSILLLLGYFLAGKTEKDVQSTDK